MWKENFLFFILLVINFAEVISYASSQPIWITSPYFRAGNDKVISTMTGNTSKPTYTFTFSSPLSGIPNLAYGIKNYRGNDTLLNEMFQIRRENLTASTFRVSMQIYGFTNIFLLAVPYLAIDPLFPHHLNSFDNVALNYSSGPLVNFSVQSSVAVYHTQTINYTQQSAANRYKTFQLPLTSNKLVLFITSFYVLGSGDTVNFFPVQLDINYTIINQSHYKWTARIFRNATVTSIRFSQIIYNQDDVTASNLYKIVYSQWIVNSSGGYIQFPQQLVDNMILALTDFHSINGRCGFQYNWHFMTNFSNTSFGIKINNSLPTNYNCGFDYARSTLFYIKTWQCGVPYIYFNLTTDLCQNACADYYYENSTAKTCDSCYYACIDCSQGSSSTSCTQCQTGLNRVLVNNTCVCSSGTFDDGYSPGCRNCSLIDPKCLTCSYPLNSSKGQSYYQTVFSSGTWASDIIVNFTCNSCAANYFINSSGLCQTCGITYCTTCLNLTACSVCNSSATAVKYTNNLCYLCNISDCAMCNSNNVCFSCNSGFVLTNGSCLTCNASCTCGGWVLPKVNGTCSTLCGDGYKLGSEQCDDNNTNSHDGCSSTCKIQACSQNCSCDGWTFPVLANGSCTTVCGDGLVRGSEQCDDNNTSSHDGCSSTCVTQACSASCLCDGWIAPWVNNSCSTLCGDGFTRGTQQCDDNNTNNHDGCSSICKVETCSQNCSCDGWNFPVLANGSCSTVCGDGFKRGSQECDDSNVFSNDGCSSICLNQIIVSSESVFLQSSWTFIPGLLLFASGFKIVGTQMLNVFQSFQLMAYSQNLSTFQISFNVHGYTNQGSFPFQIPGTTNIFTYFNFMFIGIVILFSFSLCLQVCGSFTSKSNRVQNSKNFEPDKKQKNNKTQTNAIDQKIIDIQYDSMQQKSQQVDDFTVHYKGAKQNKSNRFFIKNKKANLNQSIIINQQTNKSAWYTIFLRQIFHDMLINLLYIFIFASIEQVRYNGINSLLNFNSILVIGIMSVFLIFSLAFCSYQSSYFGENQLKFHRGKWMIYWIIVVLERIIFCSLISSKYEENLIAILIIKSIIIVYFMCSEIFYFKIQKRRNILIQVLHLLLIGVLLVSQKGLLNNQNTFKPPKFFFEYLYVGILGLVFLITIFFYIRQLVYKCQADYRRHNQDEILLVTQQNAVSAIFDAKVEDQISESANSLYHTKNQDQKSSNWLDQAKTIKDNKRIVTQREIKQNRSYAVARNKRLISSKKIEDQQELRYSSIHTKKTYQRHKRSNLVKQNKSKPKNNIFDEDEEAQQRDDEIVEENIFQNNKQNEEKFQTPKSKSKNKKIFMKSMRRIALKNQKRPEHLDYKQNRKNQKQQDLEEEDNNVQVKRSISDKVNIFDDVKRVNQNKEKQGKKNFLKSQHIIRAPKKNSRILRNIYRQQKSPRVYSINQGYSNDDYSDNYDALSIKLQQ